MSEICAALTRNTYVGAKAATYDADRELEQKWRNEHAAVTRYLSEASGSVLDIPVGTGRFLSLYRDLGLEVIGMDVSDEMMRQAVAKDGEADIRHGDILAIDLPDMAVESAVCIRLLNLITQDEMQQSVRELCRVAKERVILSIRTADRQSVQRRSLTHLHSAFYETVAKSGFEVRDETVVWKNNYRVVQMVRCV